MSYRIDAPETATLEEKIRLAKAERSVYIGYMIGEGLTAATRAVRNLLDRGDGAEERRMRRMLSPSIV